MVEKTEPNWRKIAYTTKAIFLSQSECARWFNVSRQAISRATIEGRLAAYSTYENPNIIWINYREAWAYFRKSTHLQQTKGARNVPYRRTIPFNLHEQFVNLNQKRVVT